MNGIHQNDVNIAIYNRDISYLSVEINYLLAKNIEYRASGDIDTILEGVKKTINPHKCHLVIQDIHDLLKLFKEITSKNSFRLLLATVNSNMCRMFHTDMNSLRMLCTYIGPGTLWLKEDNINRRALNSIQSKQSIAIEEERIQQVSTGSVAILKGALYPKENTKAIVHRSPTIEESGKKRLLLRIDTVGLLDF